jgi:hypothetical protein
VAEVRRARNRQGFGMAVPEREHGQRSSLARRTPAEFAGGIGGDEADDQQQQEDQDQGQHREYLWGVAD